MQWIPLSSVAIVPGGTDLCSLKRNWKPLAPTWKLVTRGRDESPVNEVAEGLVRYPRYVIQNRFFLFPDWHRDRQFLVCAKLLLWAGNTKADLGLKAERVSVLFGLWLFWSESSSKIAKIADREREREEASGKEMNPGPF